MIDGLRGLAAASDVILCDIWGVVHNGLQAWPDACAALARFRRDGGTVVLITNAPRPADAVQRMLDRLAVPREIADATVSSGDLTCAYIADHRNEAVLHIGPERDNSLFRDFDLRFEPVERADYIVCSGLFDDEHETAEVYRPMLMQASKRGLQMVCANPDIVVERGEKLVYCAGALAELYEQLGGKVLWAGKPHPAIYEHAMTLAAKARGATTPAARVLAIGDSVRTDLAGANRMGVRCLFITSGIHGGELGGSDNPQASALAQLFASASRPPVAVMPKLKW